jgi:DNA-binding CsgD family transcriptional regulator
MGGQPLTAPHLCIGTGEEIMQKTDKHQSGGETQADNTEELVTEVQHVLEQLEKPGAGPLEGLLMERLENIEQKLRRLEVMIESSRLSGPMLNLNELIENIIVARINADRDTSLQALRTVVGKLLEGSGGQDRAGMHGSEGADAASTGHATAPVPAERTVSIPDKAKEKLSNREQEIVEQLLEGKSNKEISEALNISEKTVKNNLWRIYRKFGVDSRNKLFHLLVSNDHTTY